MNHACLRISAGYLNSILWSNASSFGSSWTTTTWAAILHCSSRRNCSWWSRLRSLLFILILDTKACIIDCGSQKDRVSFCWSTSIFRPTPKRNRTACCCKILLLLTKRLLLLIWRRRSHVWWSHDYDSHLWQSRVTCPFSSSSNKITAGVWRTHIKVAGSEFASQVE